MKAPSPILTNKITILGSGTSTGVPIPTCRCPVCLSTYFKNKRLRTSIHLQTKLNHSFIVDTTPDFRTQVLGASISHIDAVIITHDHADHVHGIDDLRPFCYGNPPQTIPVYTSPHTCKNLTQHFPYIFQADVIFANKPIIGGGIPHLELHPIKTTPGKVLPISLLGQAEKPGEFFEFFLLPHGYTQTLGFIHDKFAYLTDCHSIPANTVEKLRQKQLDLLIIDCIKRTPHSTHLHLQAAIDYIEQIKPKKAGLIHLSHDFDHEQLEQELFHQFKDFIFPLYDGQILNYSY